MGRVPLKTIFKTVAIVIAALAVLTIMIIILGVWLNNRPDLLSMENCQVDADCVIVKYDHCGGALAIHKSKHATWNFYLKRQDVLYSFPWARTVCKTTLPLDYFEARCVQKNCAAEQINSP